MSTPMSAGDTTTIILYRGASIEVSCDVTSALGFACCSPLIAEAHDAGVLVRPMTIEEQVDIDRAARIAALRR